MNVQKLKAQPISRLNQYILPLFVAAFSLIAGVCCATAEKPNVVVFLVDDLGYMDVSPNNPNCFYETPNIEALANAGMRFTDGYAANPVCSPTRYSLMTGRYPTRVGATNFFPKSKGAKLRSGTFNPAPLTEEMPLGEVTLADAFRAQGYATFFAGKWHLGHGEAFFPLNRGFDINIGGNHNGGPYTGKKYFAPFNNPQMEEESPAGEHMPARLARETVSFIQSNKDRPFFAYFSFYSVHTPLMGRPDLVAKYKEKAKQISGKEFDQVSAASGKKSKRRILQKHAVYAAMVEAMDEAVGEVIQALKDADVWDHTIIVFTSDNGGLATSEGLPTSNLPFNGGKGWVFEGGIREPWIIRYPGVTEEGSISDAQICSIDLFPTLVAAAGYEAQHEIDGLDLRPVLVGGALDRDALYWHYPHYSNQGGIPGGAIRMGDYKLVENFEDGSVALFNLQQDIGETKDLCAAQPERVSEMRARLHAWYEKYDAEFLRPKGKDGPTPWRP
ncbi:MULTISPECIES: sulfatase [unclassified Lentimonas]|uniref:sulfatase n=1 Tax=unclassified Lentimonas TaxID=2630993 RepID=UPI001323CC35|nr:MULTISPECIES: sulfatase [unclassified Lentimonas]CAA6691250.1 Unannotated [Lentimonas sp. CC10]CAA6695879.1 Unannotated [Lentimonas sp. CC19]CAA7068648.1 Unannotated [Lentimonas sp. CC11]